MANLLLVDDNTQLLDLYKVMLEHAGHRVSTADNRADAVSLLHDTGPEIVIMDLRMPKMEDGLDLIRAVNNFTPSQRAAPPKIVVISGWAEDLLDRPEKDHVARVLSKPVRMEVLLRSISELALVLCLCLVVLRPGRSECPQPAAWIAQPSVTMALRAPAFSVP